MSVEISGPKGYEWQYRITALIALQNISADEILVETPGSEDAKLKFTEKGAFQSVELQAKSSKEDITPEILCEWLVHFPAHASTGSLLERLLDGGVIAVFAAEGRCTDDIRYSIRSLGQFSPHPKVSNDFTKAVLAALFNYSSTNPKDKRLAKDRKLHLEKIAQQLAGDTKRLAEALQRVVIWESTSLETMNQMLAGTLQYEHIVPQLKCPGVILAFDEAVRSARDKSENVIPKIARLLSIHSADALLGDVPHLANEQEKTVFSILKTSNVVLLTGRSQCGKTHMAKYLGQQLQYEGVRSQIGNDVSEANRFLAALNQESRMFLLDDPFDGRNPSDFSAISETLRRLVNEIRSHRFLIVTSTKEKVAPLANLLAPHAWIDLSVIEVQPLMEFWNDVCMTKDLTEVSRMLKEGLEGLSVDELPQPGHLRHLSRLPNLQGCSPEQLIRLARFDIKRLADAISEWSPSSRRIHLGLCAGASTVKRISQVELGYIISNSDERPGFDKLGFRKLGASDAQKFPRLTSPQSLSDEVILELQRLEKSGNIREIGGKIEFAHPDYLAVSKEIVASASSIGFERLLAIVERSLASLDEDVAVNSAGILDQIYRHQGDFKINRGFIFDVAEKGMSSIFPAVRDAVAIVLIGWLPTLERNHCRTALSLIKSNDFEDYQIRWNADTPWTTSENSWDDLLAGTALKREHFDDDFLRSVVDPNSGISLSPSVAWDLVHYIDAHPLSINSNEILVELMNQQHAFIRAKAVAILIDRNINEPSLYLATILGEANPRVMHEAIAKIFYAWNRANDVTRYRLIDWLSECLRKVPVSIVCSRLLVDFGDPYSSETPNWQERSELERKALWLLWSELLPVYLYSIANQPFVHNGSHMYHSMDVARMHLHTETYAKLLESWVVWIEGQLKLRSLDDSEISVAELIYLHSEQGEDRERVIAKILQHHDTGFVFTTVSSMVDYWESLSKVEITLLENVLQGDRSDVRWLRAVSITRDVVPSSIQKLVLGKEDLLSLLPSSILELVPEDLLSDALHLYCGTPQPLWWYGLHHRAKPLWNVLIKQVLRDPTHRNFDLAVREHLVKLQNVGRIDSDFTDIWRTLCSYPNREVRRRLFRHLLECSLEINGFDANGVRVWEIFFEEVQDELEIQEYIPQILENLERISMNTDSLSKLFGSYASEKHLAPRMHQEIAFVVILKKILRENDRGLRSAYLKAMEQILTDSPPRLIRLLQGASAQLKDSLGNEVDSIIVAIEVARRELIEKSSLQRDRFENKDEIWDWNESRSET